MQNNRVRRECLRNDRAAIKRLKNDRARTGRWRTSRVYNNTSAGIVPEALWPLTFMERPTRYFLCRLLVHCAFKNAGVLRCVGAGSEYSPRHGTPCDMVLLRESLSSWLYFLSCLPSPVCGWWGSRFLKRFSTHHCYWSCFLFRFTSLLKFFLWL